MTATITRLPVPAPPKLKFVPAADAVAGRSGTSVAFRIRKTVTQWAVHVRREDGSEDVKTGPAGAMATLQRHELAEAAARAVRELGGSGPVFTADSGTARAMEAHTALEVSQLCVPPAAREALEAALDAMEPAIVAGLTLACDASRGNRTDINGSGWILDYGCGFDPIVGASTDTAVHGGIRAGELSAIRRGVQASVSAHKSLQEGMGTLTVLSDSRRALELLERLRSDATLATDDSEAVGEGRRILGLLKNAKVEFQWVRGHSGHPLNEIADRLAVLARRNAEMGISQDVAAVYLQRIREEAASPVPAAA